MRLFLIFFILIHALHAFEIEHFLMPKDGKKAERTITRDILGAKKKIDVAMFMVTNKKLVNALKERARKGEITIRLIADKSYDTSHLKNSKVFNLIGHPNIAVYRLQGLRKKKNPERGILHAKLILIDDKITYIGSANWTKSAFRSNYEILIKITDQATAALYQSFFDKMQNLAVPYDLK